ncbi:MAG: cell division suppressor protein YneA [Bacillota bacterium]|jgi:hypothetical protein
MKRRYKIKIRLLMIMTIFLFGFIFTWGFAFNAKAENELWENKTNLVEVMVQSGDTLWDIAEDYFPQSDTRKVVYKIRKLNNLKTPIIKPGQIIKLPIINE